MIFIDYHYLEGCLLVNLVCNMKTFNVTHSEIESHRREVKKPQKISKWDNENAKKKNNHENGRKCKGRNLRKTSM